MGSLIRTSAIPKTLPHPFRIGAYPLIRLFGQVDLLQKPVDPRPGEDIGDPVEAGNEAKVLPRIHVLVETDVLRQVTDDFLDLQRVARRIVPADPDRPRGRFGETQEHQHRRRLPGPVGPQETENLPFGDIEAQVVHGRLSAVALGQLFDLDDSLSFHR